MFRGHDHGLFTTAFFHRPSQLADEVELAGFDSCDVFNIEGPGFLGPDFDSRWISSERREVMLRAARLIEQETELLGAASHLMAVARTPTA